MTLRDVLALLVKKKEDEELELPIEETVTDKLNVRIDNLNGMEDVDRLTKLLREGNVLFLKTRDLQKRDLGEFQTSVQKLKRSCTQNGFDIVGTEDGYLIVTPNFVQIAR
jgi:SepF-like predicted cell division protein (DUF552 family)